MEPAANFAPRQEANRTFGGPFATPVPGCWARPARVQGQYRLRDEGVDRPNGRGGGADGLNEPLHILKDMHSVLGGLREKQEGEAGCCRPAETENI